MLRPFELADNDETANKTQLGFREAVEVVPRGGLRPRARASGAGQESCFWRASGRKRKRKVAVWFHGVLQYTDAAAPAPRPRQHPTPGSVDMA